MLFVRVQQWPKLCRVSYNGLAARRSAVRAHTCGVRWYVTCSSIVLIQCTAAARGPSLPQSALTV